MTRSLTFALFLILYSYPLPAEASSKSSTTSMDNPIPLADLEGEPSAIVNGVNVITGDFIECQCDMSLPGIKTLNLERSCYSTDPRYGNLSLAWNFNFGSTLILDEYSNKKTTEFRATLLEGCGSTSFFYSTSRKNIPAAFEMTISKEMIEKGTTNTSIGLISGRTNIKNTKVMKHENQKPHVRTSFGVNQYFEKVTNREGSRLQLQITREVEPTGDYVLYEYQNKDHLASIQRMSKTGKTVSSYTFNQINKKLLEVTTNDNQKIRYHLSKKGLLEQVESSQAPWVTYQYDVKKHHPEKINRRDHPENRFLKIDYFEEDKNIDRVQTLSAPAGTDATPIITHTFKYRDGYTSVYDTLNRKTHYKYNQNQRLTEIEKFGVNNQTYCREKFYWGGSDTNQSTNLKTRTFENQYGTLQFMRVYQYDDNHNIKSDRLYGNLSGNNPEAPKANEHGNPLTNTCEYDEKQYEYTNDGLNLVARETSHRQSALFIYEPGTDRLTAKLKSGDGMIYIREFYEYNEDGALTKEIIDDGRQIDKNNLEGVTERHIKNITPFTTFPFGLPQIIEERYLDLKSQAEKFIHKTINAYSAHGQLEKQEHYDSKGEYAYTLIWKYDDHGNIEEETDALGRTITRTYDANDNQKTEKGPQQDITIDYDYMNRPIREVETHSDNLQLVTNHRYDYLGNRIATIDSYGNETLYTYDAFGRIVETLSPPILNEQGQLDQPKVHIEYGEMNQVTSVTDARGNKTQMTYTIRSQPVEVIYADGTTEKTLYNIDGTVKTKREKNNTTTQYTYDYAQRPIKQETYSSSGELLATTSAAYNSFHLLSETDPAGHLTTYEYYPNGQLLCKTKGKSITHYEYDPLGRHHKTIETYGPHPEDIVVKVQEHDLLGRVYEERIEDFQGNLQSLIHYRYDHSGNREKVIVHHQQGTSETITLYNSFQQPWKVIDPEGNTTLTHYRFDYRNQYGQCVPYQETIDPLGNITQVIKDTAGRNVSLIRKNSLGQLTQQQEMIYDSAGNRIKLIETILAPQTPHKQIITTWTYDAANRLTSCLEAVGTPEQKQTTHIYNPLGQKAEIIKPDGSKLFHSYDTLGRLSAFYSSDDTFYYTYEYDQNSNVIKVEDPKNNISTLRDYDDSDHLMKETLGNGLTLKYTYDGLGRLSTIIYPDDTSLKYIYRASQLKEIQRVGKETYSHEYRSYDLSGHILETKLIGESGTISYQYDTLGRLQKTESPMWKETIHTYDKVGNLLSKEVQESETILSTFTYDDLYQLESERGVSSHHYQHDSAYNCIEKDGHSNTFNALNQPISQPYNPNGCLIQRNSDESFVYDTLDRLITYIKEDLTVRYTYDELNRRIQKRVFAHNQKISDIRYLYQGQNEIGTCNEHGQIQELRFLGIGRGAEIGAAIAIELSGEAYAPVHDVQGNVACLLDMRGKPFETYRYTAFGEETDDTSRNPWRFSSKRVDAETGLIYFGQRYYDNSTNRWLTPDPLGYVGGPNLYAYVLNNPLTHVDLHGLFESPGEIGMHRRVIGKPSHRLGENLVRLVGRAVQGLGHHAIPIPFVKDVVEFTGWCLSFKNPKNYVPDWRRPHSKVIDYRGVNGQLAPSSTVMLYSGLGVSEKQVMKRTADASLGMGDIDVITVYKGDRGFALNALEYGLQSFGVEVRSTQVAREAANLANKRAGENGTIYVLAHSQGGLVLDKTPPDIKRKMIAYTLGSAKIAQSEEYKYAMNYIAQYDIVSYFDPLGMVKGCCIGNIYFDKSIGNPLKNHFWDGKTYQENLKDIFSEILKNK